MRYLATRRNDGLDLARDFGRILDSFMGEDTPMTERVPKVDIEEEENRYRLTAEIPGKKEDDIDVSVNDGVLTLSSEEKTEKKDEEQGYLVRERRESSFQRSFVLPKNADAAKIEANYRDGLLELDIPKKAESKPRSIKVNRSK